MATVPFSRNVLGIEQCTAERFDEAYLRVTKGEKIENGYFSYAHGALKRFLLLSNSEPLCSAWDDGTGGRAGTLKEFFEPLLHEPRHLNFDEAASELVEALAVSWQRIPDAHTSPGLLDPAVLVKALLERGLRAVIRVRHHQLYSLAVINEGQLEAFFKGGDGQPADDQSQSLWETLNSGRDEIALDVYENPDAARSEDWAQVPKDFQEGMVRFYALTAPHIVLLLGDRELQRLQLTTGRTMIGREPTNDLVIDNLSVSRRHCAVTYNEGLCTIEDLGSSNGTVIDSKKISGPTPLTDGTEVTVGKHTLLYLERAAIQAPAMQGTMEIDQTVFMRPAQVSAATGRTKQLPILTVAGQSFVVRSTPFAIGSDQDNNLPLQGRGIKPRHAELKRDAGGQLWVSHEGGLLSSTRINGQKIKVAPLQSGDLIQLGSVLVRFHLRTEHATA